MAASREELGRALVRAHRAGDTRSARALAVALQASSESAIDIKGAEDAAVQGVADAVTSPIDRFAIGAGETLKTAGGRVASALTQVLPDRVSNALGLPQEAATAEANKALTQRVTGFAAGAGRVAPTLAPARLGTSLTGAIATGAGVGALTAGDTATEGAALGAAGGGVGYGVGNVVGRAANAAVGKFAERTIKGSDDAAAALRTAQTLGFRFTPGTASGGAVARTVDAAMTSNPVTRAPFAKLHDHNAKLLNRLATKAMGVEASDLGPSTLAAVDQHLGQQFDQVAKSIKGVPVAPEVASDLDNILPKTFLKNYSNEIGSGNITGRSYMDIRSRLLEVTRSNSDKSGDAWDVINELDDAVSKNAPKHVKQLYDTAREKYRVLIAVEKYANNIKGGDIKEGNLNNSLRRVFGKSYTRATGAKLKATNEFMDAVRAMSDPRVGAPFGNSGTADRLLPWAVGAGLVLHPTPASIGAVAAGVVGSHAYLGAASKAASQAGGVVGRSVPNMLNQQRP